MKTLLLGINSKYIHPNLAIRLLKANTDYDVDIKEFNIKVLFRFFPDMMARFIGM